MADIIPNSFKKNILNGSIDLDTDTIKVMLLTNVYTPNQDVDEYISAIVANEASGTGYTAGGATLAGATVTQDNTDNEGVFDGNDVTWPTSSITARYAVLYKDTGNQATSPIIAIKDFGSDKTSDAGDFTITWNTEGILNAN